MSEEAELQAKIAAISSRIDQHKQHRRAPSHPHQPQAAWRGYPRWSPYGRGGRGGRGGYPATHRNRTLVLNGQNSPSESTTSDHKGNAANVRSDTGLKDFVSARGVSNQLMSKETYERESKRKFEGPGGRAGEKRRIRNQEEQSKLAQHMTRSANHEDRILEIEGIRFRLQEDGSKLIRVPDSNLDAKPTPQRATIAGVPFLRTKKGNLLRAIIANTHDRPSKREQCQHFTKNGTTLPPSPKSKRKARNLTCNCPFGPSCKFAHDPSQVAICKDFLHSGTCSLGDNCDLSHEPTYHRVSACTHFLRGNCTNDACRYPHVNVSPAAPVCRSFATLGYCAKGAKCDKRHVIECPDYANSGHCANRENGKCPLPHPDRASTLRKAAQRQAKMNAGSENSSDLSSDDEKFDDEEDVEDVDSDHVDEDIIMGASSDENHELTQQQDYVAFS